MIAASIKRCTAAVHVDAENAVGAFAPFASRDRYASYLRLLLSFYEAIEPELAVRLDGIVDEARTRFVKRRAIAADLAWLGGDAGGPAAMRVVVGGPPLRSTAGALGVAYVLEGKTLGARFLLAEAKATLGLDADRGATFLAGYGARTGSMWNAYRASLERWVTENGKRATVLAGARATFESFIACVSSAAPSLQRRAAS
jgi:heme oxygenase